MCSEASARFARSKPSKLHLWINDSPIRDAHAAQFHELQIYLSTADA